MERGLNRAFTVCYNYKHVNIEEIIWLYIIILMKYKVQHFSPEQDLS